MSNLNDIMQSKDNLIKKVNEENKLLVHKMERLDGERHGTIEKIETILFEQTELREKDQAIFAQISQTRDQLQSQVESRDFELTEKNLQISSMMQST